MPAEALPRGSVSWLEPRPLLQKEAAGISLGAAGVLSKPFVCRSFVLLFLSECRCLYLLQNLAQSFIIYMSNMWPRSRETGEVREIWPCFQEPAAVSGSQVGLAHAPFASKRS